MALTIADIQIVLGANIIGFQNGMNGVQASLGNVRTAIFTTGALLDKHLTQPIVKLGKIAIKAGIEFEKSMVEIQAITGETAGTMENLSMIALEMSKNTLFSANEAAGGMLELLKAGISAEDVAGQLKGTMDLAAAGSIDLADAAIVVATSLSAFSDEALNASKIANIMAGAAVASTADVHSLRLGMSQASAVAASVGMTLEDTASALALFANNGLRGSDAGTSFKTMLLNLQPHTKKQTELFQKLGLVTERGTSKFFDQNDKIKDLAGIADTLNVALEGMSDAQRLATLQTLFGTDAIRAANILFKEGKEGVTDLKEAIGNVTAEQIAEDMTKSLSAQLTMLKNDVERAGISIYAMADGPLTWIVEKLRFVVNWFEQTNDVTKGIIISIALFAAAIGPAIFIVGQLGLAFEALAIIGGLQAGWMLRFIKAMLPMTAKMIILGTVIYLLKTYWSELTNEVKYFVERFQNYVIPALIAVIAAMAALGAILMGVSAKWVLIAAIAAAFAALAYIVATNWSAIAAVFKALPVLIGAGFRAMYYDAKKTFLGLITIVYNAFNKMLDVIQAVLDKVGATGFFTTIIQGFYSARRAVYAFGAGLQNSLNNANESFNNATGDIGAAQRAISTSWSTLTNSVVDQVTRIVNGVKAIGNSVVPNTDAFKNSLKESSDESKNLANNMDETTNAMKDFTEETTQALTALDYFDHQIKILSTQLEIFKLKNNLADDSVEYLGKSIATFTAQQKIAALKVKDLAAQLGALSSAGQNNTKEFLETENALYDAMLQYEKLGQAIEDAGAKARASNADWVKVTEHVSTLAKTTKEAAKITQGSNFGTVATTLGAASQNIIDLSKGSSSVMSSGASTIMSGNGISYPNTGISNGTVTPNDSVSTTPQMSYAPVVVQNLYIRKESDIEDISKELFKLQQNQLRARGVTP